jgi:hypothetical protein
MPLSVRICFSSSAASSERLREGVPSSGTVSVLESDIIVPLELFWRARSLAWVSRTALARRCFTRSSVALVECLFTDMRVLILAERIHASLGSSRH